MAVAVVQEWDSGGDRSTAVYDEMGKAMNVEADPPDGMISHAAGFDGNTWRIFDVWESEDHYQRFFEDRVMPSLQQTSAQGEPPQVRTYELHNFQIP